MFHGNSPVMSFQKQKRPQWGAINNDAGIHDLSDTALRSHSSKSSKTATKHLKTSTRPSVVDFKAKAGDKKGIFDYKAGSWWMNGGSE